MATTRLPTWQLIAILVGIAGCVVLTLLFAVIGNPFAGSGGDTSGDDRSPSVSVSSLAPGTGPSTETDETEAFRAFAVLDTVRTPPWLELVTRVYWTGEDELWAETTLPAGVDGQDTEIRSICGVMSSFVLRTRAGAWSPVSVRAADGSELLTRAERDGRCVL